MQKVSKAIAHMIVREARVLTEEEWARHIDLIVQSYLDSADELELMTGHRKVGENHAT